MDFSAKVVNSAEKMADHVVAVYRILGKSPKQAFHDSCLSTSYQSFYNPGEDEGTPDKAIWRATRFINNPTNLAVLISHNENACGIATFWQERQTRLEATRIKLAKVIGRLGLNTLTEKVDVARIWNMRSFMLNYSDLNPEVIASNLNSIILAAAPRLKEMGATAIKFSSNNPTPVSDPHLISPECLLAEQAKDDSITLSDYCTFVRRDDPGLATTHDSATPVMSIWLAAL
ncbi:MAG: hypothetical protein WAS94_00425 [Candidatus Saccharimonadales bacterium]